MMAPRLAWDQTLTIGRGGIAGPVKHAAIFDGEVYDAREQPGYLVADQPNNRCSSVLSR